MRKNILKTFGIGATVLMIFIAFLPLVSCQPSGDIGINPLKESQRLSCFPTGTKITMVDGTYKNIEDIQIGDRILSYNIKSNCFTSWTVKMEVSPYHPVWEINNGLIRMTDDHPLRIKKSDGKETWGVINVEEGKAATVLDNDIAKIEIGDYLFTQEGNWVKIYEISSSSTVIKTYDILSYFGRQTYFANGILAHEENTEVTWWIHFYANKFFTKHPNAFPLLRLLLKL
jgi:hypothetical protein